MRENDRRVLFRRL